MTKTTSTGRDHTAGNQAAYAAAEEVFREKRRQQIDDLKARFQRALVSSPQLRKRLIAPKPVLLGPFLRSADTGFIFAERGLGKTWLSMSLSMAVAAGGNLGPWKAERACKVLYIDCEMPADLTQARDRSLDCGTENLIYLHHEILWDDSGTSLNFAEPDQQEALISVVDDLGVELVILDNISTGILGLEHETNNHEWEKIMPLIMGLRHRNIALVFIAHAGANGKLRGATKKQDAASWILSLQPSPDDTELAHGFAFQSVFTKAPRMVTRDDLPPLNWKGQTISGTTEITCEPADGDAVITTLIGEGYDTCKMLSEALDLPAYTVSRRVKVLKEMKPPRVKMAGKKYALP